MIKNMTITIRETSCSLLCCDNIG